MPASSFNFPIYGFPTAGICVEAPSWIAAATPAFPRWGYPGPFRDNQDGVASGSRVNIWSNEFTGDQYLHLLIARGLAASGSNTWGSVGFGGYGIFLNSPWEVGAEFVTSGGTNYTYKAEGISFIFAKRGLVSRDNDINQFSTQLRTDSYLRCTFKPANDATTSVQNVVCEISYRSSRTGAVTTLATQTTSGTTAQWGNDKLHEFRVSFDPGDSNKIRMYSTGVQPGTGAGFDMTTHLNDYAFPGLFDSTWESYPFLGWDFANSSASFSLQACRISAWGVAGLLSFTQMPNFGPAGSGATAATEDPNNGAYFPGDDGGPPLTGIVVPNNDVVVARKIIDLGTPVGTGGGIVITPPTPGTSGQLFPQGNA